MSKWSRVFSLYLWLWHKDGESCPILLYSALVVTHLQPWCYNNVLPGFPAGFILIYKELS